jgi:HEAT repeat protein
MPVVLQGLASGDWESRFLAAAFAERLGPTAVEAEPLLFAAVDDPERDVAEVALDALMAIRPTSTERTCFVARFLHDKELAVAAAVALEKHARNLFAVFGDVIALARHPHANGRRFAAVLLARDEFRVRERRSCLLALAKDDDDLVRRGAADSLVTVGACDDAIPVYRELLESDHSFYRAKAARSLGELRDVGAEVEQRLRVMVAMDECESVRRAARAALASLRAAPQ